MLLIRRYLGMGMLVALVAALGCGTVHAQAGDKTGGDKARELANRLSAEYGERQKELKELQPEIKYMEALSEWRSGALSWLDELYDLAARAPHDKSFRVSQVTITPLTAKAPKDKDQVHYTAPMMIECKVTRDKESLVMQLVK